MAENAQAALEAASDHPELLDAVVKYVKFKYKIEPYFKGAVKVGVVGHLAARYGDPSDKWCVLSVMGRNLLTHYLWMEGNKIRTSDLDRVSMDRDDWRGYVSKAIEASKIKVGKA